MAATSGYLNTKGAAGHLACSTSYLEKCRVTGGGPRFHKIGKAVRYRIEELDAFASAREHRSTAEYAHGLPIGGEGEGVSHVGRWAPRQGGEQ
jgi:hypothetical protein